MGYLTALVSFRGVFFSVVLKAWSLPTKLHSENLLDGREPNPIKRWTWIEAALNGAQHFFLRSVWKWHFSISSFSHLTIGLLPWKLNLPITISIAIPRLFKGLLQPNTRFQNVKKKKKMSKEKKKRKKEKK